jgi:hypothetical protein
MSLPATDSPGTYVPFVDMTDAPLRRWSPTASSRKA